MSNFRNTNPTELVNRLLLLEELKKLPPKEVQFFNERLITVFDEENDKGEKIEVVEIDWEFCLFKATLFELADIFNNYHQVEKQPEEEKKKLIIT